MIILDRVYSERAKQNEQNVGERLFRRGHEQALSFFQRKESTANVEGGNPTAVIIEGG